MPSGLGALGSMLLACMAAVAFAEEEERASDVSVSMAATLLGAISFQMLLFYFLNHRDKDMRRYTYEAVSTTVSIFCAVLIFQSVNDVIETYFLEGKSTAEQAVIDIAHMLFWFAVMQIALAYISGAIGKTQPTDANEMECDLKCFAVLLAHITGFAANNAFGTVQHLEFFSSSPLRAFLVLPVAALSLTLLMHITDTFREKVSLGDDGVVDKYEMLWDEETEESENDVIGLALSFLTVQAVRFSISGVFPNEEGEESPLETMSHTYGELALFLGFAILCIGLLSYIVYTEKEDVELMELEGEEFEKAERANRIKETMTVATMMSFAWSFFFGMRWFLASLRFSEEPMQLGLALALTISFISFGSIRGLDCLADLDSTGPKADRIIWKIIAAIGVLIGFAWEQCFDAAVSSIASRSSSPSIVKLALAIFCVVLIVPAWRLYILPMVVRKGWLSGFVIQGHHHLKDLAETHKQFEEEEEKAEKLKEAILTKKNQMQLEQSNKLSKPLLQGA